MHTYNIKPRKEFNLITILIQKFLPFWPLFLILAILGVLFASVYLMFQTPKYRSSASLIINDNRKGVSQSQLMESFNVFESKKIVENEIEVLRSKDILKDAIYNLGLYVKIYKPNFLKDQLLFEDVPVKIIMRDSTDIVLNINKKIKPIEFNINYKESIVQIEGQTYPLNHWINNPFGGSQIKFLVHNTETSRPNETLKFCIVHPRILTNEILENLYVNTTSKVTSIISLQYTSPIPELGNSILDQLIVSYKKSATDHQVSLASNTLNFIDNRILEVENELQTVEKDLENYRAMEGVINLGEQGYLYLQNIGDYDKRISEINLQLSVLDKVELYVIGKNKSSGIVPSTLGVNDQILENLLERLYDAEIQYEEFQKTTAENNPILVTLRDKIKKIRPSILENVGSLKSNLLASKNSLLVNSGKYNSALAELPGQERIYAEITRNKKSISDLYDFLLQKREEAALSLTPTIGNVRVIEQAEATIHPISPKKPLVYLMGLITPLIFGFSWVAGKELVSSKVLFRSELESNTTLPIIGELSYVDLPKNERLVIKHKNLSIKDEFRNLISDLQLFGTTNKSQTLLITSNIEGEGKSYISANLALTLASLGTKTALVDLDLRKAEISNIFGVNKSQGIKDFLTSKINNPYGIQKDYGLTVFSAGKAWNDSFDLLQYNQPLKHLMTFLKKNYEIIIIDTPPISLVADASIVSSYADLSLLVVRHNYTPKFLLPQIEETIKRKKLDNTSIIFNGLKPRGAIKKYGYGFGYN